MDIVKVKNNEVDLEGVLGCIDISYLLQEF